MANNLLSEPIKEFFTGLEQLHALVLIGNRMDNWRSIDLSNEFGKESRKSKNSSPAGNLVNGREPASIIRTPFMTDEEENAREAAWTRQAEERLLLRLL